MHRLLAAAIGVAPLPLHLSSKTYLHDLCANMNRRQRSARDAGRSSVQLHTLIFFAGAEGDGTSSGGGGPKEEHAYVLDVETSPGTDPSLTVIVPRYGIEGQVKLPVAANDKHLIRSPAEHRISYEDENGLVTSIRVFDKIKLKVWVKISQDHQRELILDLLQPIFGDTSEKGLPSEQKRTESAESSSRAKKRQRTSNK